MKSSLTPDTPLAETGPGRAAPGDRVEVRRVEVFRGRAAGARSFLAMLVVVRTGLILMLATLGAATLAIFVVALALSLPVDIARWVLGSGQGLAGWHVAHLLQLLKISAVCGLVVAPFGCAPFVADLRRQDWL